MTYVHKTPSPHATSAYLNLKPPEEHSHWPHRQTGPCVTGSPATLATQAKSLSTALTWNTLFCSLIFRYFSSSGCRWILSRYLGQNWGSGTGQGCLTGSSVPPTPRWIAAQNHTQACGKRDVGGGGVPSHLRHLMEPDPWCQQLGPAQDTTAPTIATWDLSLFLPPLEGTNGGQGQWATSVGLGAHGQNGLPALPG